MTTLEQRKNKNIKITLYDAINRKDENYEYQSENL